METLTNSKRLKEKKERLKLEGQKILNRNRENATEGKGMKWMAEAKRMSARPGEDVSSTFLLPNHLDRNLTAKESAEEIADYFAKISQEFTPVEEDALPEYLTTRLESDDCEHPAIREEDTYERMKKSKKTDSVPGDIPAAVLKEFLPEFALPINAILKEAVATHTWPELYKKEFHLPLKKVPSPQSEDDLRGIGLTAFVSKQLERVVLEWIWPYV
jgi:hypothetical protein